MRKRMLTVSSLGFAVLIVLSLAHKIAAQDQKGRNKEHPARPKWEYKVLDEPTLEKLAEDDKAALKQWVMKLPENERVAAMLFWGRLQFALNKLGDQGWELAAVRGSDRHGIRTEPMYIFRRPKR
jgi:hypothetical protein